MQPEPPEADVHNIDDYRPKRISAPAGPERQEQKQERSYLFMGTDEEIRDDFRPEDGYRAFDLLCACLLLAIKVLRYIMQRTHSRPAR